MSTDDRPVFGMVTSYSGYHSGNLTTKIFVFGGVFDIDKKMVINKKMIVGGNIDDSEETNYDKR